MQKKKGRVLADPAKLIREAKRLGDGQTATRLPQSHWNDRGGLEAQSNHKSTDTFVPPAPLNVNYPHGTRPGAAKRLRGVVPFSNMRTVLFFISILVVVIGAFLYLNRTPCEGECPESAGKEYCRSLDERRKQVEFNLTYGDRVRMVINGCY